MASAFGLGPELGPQLGPQLEPLKFEPALALGAPLLLGLLVALQKQLQLVRVLELEPQLGALKVVERLRPG